MNRAVAFDFDGTLTTRDTTRFLVRALLRGRGPGRYLGACVLAARYKLGGLTPPQFRLRITSWALRGISWAEADAALIPYVQDVRRHLRRGLVKRMEEFTAQGFLVFIATASPAFAVNRIFPERPVVGTEWEQREGRFTGRLTGQDCYDEEKARRVAAFLASHDVEELHTVFSDNVADAPLFRMAQHGVLVCPDRRTREALPSYPVIEDSST